VELERDDRGWADLAASIAKPLPPEPVLWARLPPTWRQRSFGGLAWFAAGVIFLWFASGLGSGVALPGWSVWLCVAVAVAWILASVRGGLVDRLLAPRLEAARRRDADRPWLSDHRWDPRGTSGSPYRRFLRAKPRLGGFVTLAVVYTAFGMPRPVLGFWWFLGGLATTGMAWQAWRVWGVGTAHVSFAKFPFHPGERVTLHFGMSEGGAQFERASLNLRRIEELSRNPATWPPGTWRCFSLVQHRPPGELPGPDHYVTLEFDLPEDVSGTALSTPPRAYWALDVVANTTSGPYVESFLIPVYEKPSA